ncbi:hypothetical protein FO519_000759 [Halicephalobus sp. NKZ332]|nr:hypothetical protein FO519_000759 [Halicephalobus sp. NKZ332]
MVKSEYAEEEIIMSGKTSCNEEEDEDMTGDWPHDPNSVSTEERSPLRGTSENGSTGIGNEAEAAANGGISSGSGQRNGSTTPLDDRRIRRQIANCNERRRMQSINAGFQSLRSLLPRKDGEKMSKAAILQHTAEYIQCLQDEKNRLVDENNVISAQSKKRRLTNGEFVDAEEASVMKANQQNSAEIMEYLRTIDDLKLALSKEHRLRVIYEREVIEMRTKSMQDTASLGVLRAAAGVTSLLNSQSLNFDPALTRSDSSLLMTGSHTPQMHTPSTPADTLLLAASQQVYNNVLLNAAAAAAATSSPSLSTVTSAQLSPHHQSVTTNPSSPFHQPQIRSTIGDLVVSTSSGISSPACIIDGNSSVLNSIAGKTVSIQGQDQGANSQQFNQRNLQAIIEAIRHIEGGNMASRVAASSSPSPHSTDLLVR